MVTSVQCLSSVMLQRGYWRYNARSQPRKRIPPLSVNGWFTRSPTNSVSYFETTTIQDRLAAKEPRTFAHLSGQLKEPRKPWPRRFRSREHKLTLSFGIFAAERSANVSIRSEISPRVLLSTRQPRYPNKSDRLFIRRLEVSTCVTFESTSRRVTRLRYGLRIISISSAASLILPLSFRFVRRSD